MSDKTNCFGFIKNCLIEFNYPLIDTMDDDELSGIFKTSNRKFLASWALGILSDHFAAVLNTAKENGNFEEMLQQLIYQQGFCLEKESREFLNGTLPVEHQTKILSKMIKFVKIVLDRRAKTSKSTPLNVTGVEKIQNMNLNLFADGDHLDSLQFDQKIHKIDEYNEKIKEYEVLLQSKVENNGYDKYDSNLPNELELTLKKLMPVLAEFKRKSFVIIEQTNQTTKNSITVDSQETVLLKETSKYINEVLQFIKNVEIVVDFISGEFFRFHQIDKNDEIFNMVDDIRQMFESLDL